MSKGTSPLGDDDLASQLERELLLLTRHALSTSARGAVLDKSAYLLLTRLSVVGPATLRELSETFQLDSSTVNRQVSALVRQGLAVRTPGQTSTGARPVRITDHGTDQLATARRHRVEQLGELVAAWPTGDTQALVGAVRQFNVHVESRQGVEWPR